MPNTVVTPIVFIAILGVLVYFHELGHFTAAKALGMKVTEFAFGFGPKLLTLGRRKETEYTIRAVPLGGFVRLPGMDITTESPEELREREGIEPEEAFNSKPIWKRFTVILAGPFFSLLLGYLVFIFAGMVFGWPTERLLPQVEIVQAGMPADHMGLQHGDVIKEINGVRVTNGKQLIEYIHARPKQKISLVIDRGGRTLTKTATTDAVSVEKGKTEGRLGFVPSTAVERIGILESVKRGTIATRDFMTLWAKTVFSKKVTKSVGGIISIARVTDETVKYGPRYVALEIASLSLTLAVMNVIPWPILDGGHLLFLLIEKIRGRKLSPQVQIWITQVGFVVIVGLAILLFYVDIARWVSGTPLQ